MRSVPLRGMGGAVLTLLPPQPHQPGASLTTASRAGATLSPSPLCTSTCKVWSPPRFTCPVDALKLCLSNRDQKIGPLQAPEDGRGPAGNSSWTLKPIKGFRILHPVASGVAQLLGPHRLPGVCCKQPVTCSRPPRAS